MTGDGRRFGRRYGSRCRRQIVWDRNFVSSPARAVNLMCVFGRYPSFEHAKYIIMLGIWVGWSRKTQGRMMADETVKDVVRSGTRAAATRSARRSLVPWRKRRR